MQEVLDKIVKMSRGHFVDESPSADSIREFIARVKDFYKECVFDDLELFRILESIHRPRIIDNAGILEDSSDHEEWFNPNTNLPLDADREIDLHFWEHYREYLLIKKTGQLRL